MREVQFTLIEQRYDENWSDLREVTATGRIAPGLLRASAVLAAPADARPQDTSRRWLVRAEIAGLSYAPLETRIEVRKASARPSVFESAKSVMAERAVASGSSLAARSRFPATQSPGAPMEWVGSRRITRALGVGLVLFGAFIVYRSAAGLMLPTEFADVAQIGALLFQLPFVVVGLAAAAFGMIVFSLRTRVKIDHAGIQSESKFLFSNANTQQMAAAEVRALRPIVVSRTTTAGRASRFRYTLAAQSTRDLISLDAVVVKGADSRELSELAERVCRALGRDDLEYDPTPLYDLGQSGSVSPHRAGLASSLLPGAFRKAIGVAMILGFIGFALMFAAAWIGANNSEVRTRSSKAEVESPPRQAAQAHDSAAAVASERAVFASSTLATRSANGPTAPKPTRSFIDTSNNRFTFDDVAGSIKVSTNAQWSFAGDVLTLRFDSVDIDYASKSCHWAKCEALQHVRLQLRNVAHDGAADDESQSWTIAPAT